MTFYHEEFKVDTVAKRDSFHDISSFVHRAITNSGIENGICCVSTSHTTCSVFFEEYTHDIDENGDDFLNVDLSRILTKVVPPHDSKESYQYPGEKHYEAVESWEQAAEYLPNGDRTALWNGDAHIKATLLGNSVSFPILNNKLAVGKTGYIYFVDFDRTRERTRNIIVSIVG